jgi:hypothetical protein
LIWSPREIVRGFNHSMVTVKAERLSSVNFEARMPVAQLLGHAERSAVLPIEVFTFSDWGRFDPSREFGRGVTLWSAGAGARVNAAGFIFEFNVVRPLLPVDSWRLAVNFRPGW